MFAVNSLADRIIALAAAEGTVERSIKEAECPQGYRATTWPSFVSTTSPHDGTLAYELSQYLRVSRKVLRGSLGMRIESEHFWDDEHRCIYVTLFEVHRAAHDARRRRVEIARELSTLTTKLAADIPHARQTPVTLREVA